MIGGTLCAVIIIIVVVCLIGISLDEEMAVLIIGCIISFVVTSVCLWVGADVEDRELNVIIDSGKKEIIYDDNRKLQILHYEVSSKDSCRVRIRAKEHMERRKDEFTNFN